MCLMRFTNILTTGRKKFFSSSRASLRLITKKDLIATRGGDEHRDRVEEDVKNFYQESRVGESRAIYGEEMETD